MYFAKISISNRAMEIRSGASSTFVTVLILFLSAGYAPLATAFEPDEVQQDAAALIAPLNLSGPHYEISPDARTVGHMNYYQIRSDFGVFEAASDRMLRTRINEVAALAELDRISKSSLFIEAAGNTVKKPVQAIQKVVEEPVETIKGVPAGVGRLFKRTARIIKDAGESVQEYVEEQNQEKEEGEGGENDENGQSGAEVVDKGLEYGEKYTKKYLGQNASIRALAKKLNVDPYTDNAVLQARLSEVAWVMTAGSFGTGQLMPSIPGEISYLADINELVWTTDPLDLRLRNEKLLLGMGVTAEGMEKFFDNPHFSTTMETQISVSLNALAGVEGRPHVLDFAAKSTTRDEAEISIFIALGLLKYHQSRGKITTIREMFGWPYAQSANGQNVIMIPVDNLRWTQSAGESLQGGSSRLAEAYPGRGNEIWVRGSISELARAEMTRLGFSVQDRSDKRL